MIMQSARDKNIINVKSAIPTTTGLCVSLPNLLLILFIWLFFSSAVDAFEISSVTPNYGNSSEETAIIIEGSGFEPNAKVLLGDQEIPSTFINSNLIIALVPKLEPDAQVDSRDITVVNPDGEKSNTGGFEYRSPLSIKKIEPLAGPVEGGTIIVITGSGFNKEITKVKIGEVSLQDKQIFGTAIITGKTPPSEAGWKNVTVSNGDLIKVVEDSGFLYTAHAPTIEKIEPVVGDPKGSTDITITGTGFWDGAIVTIGDRNASDIIVQSALITALTSEGELGPQQVVVTNPDGRSSSQKVIFTYRSPPSIDSISPTSGKLIGGTPLTITGTGFINQLPDYEQALIVTIGGRVVEVEFNSEIELTVTTPERDEPGGVVVTVTNPDGQSSREDVVYTYNNPPPKVTGISPKSGSAGTQITLTGTGFINQLPDYEQALTVTIGGRVVKVEFNSEIELTVTTPERDEPDDVAVIVTNPDGQHAEAIFTYNPSPKINGISPPGGNPNVIIPVTITGENFIERIPGMTDRIQVQVGNIQLGGEDIQFLSSNKLRIFAPRSQPDTARIVVINPDGQSSKEEVVYIYNPPPKVTNISPKSGPVSTKITLTGENFIPEILEESLRVTIGGTPVVDIKSMTPNEIQFVAPDIELFGPAPVIVINPDGQQSETIVSFTYILAPKVMNISPVSGRLEGGTKITIEGTGFIEQIDEQRIQVEFEGISVVPDADIEFVSSERLLVSTPKSNSPVTVYVIVTNPDEQQAKGKFIYNPLPKITNILPESGEVNVDTFLTITGENFIKEIPGVERELTVTIGEITEASVSFVSNQELHVITTARSKPGIVDVIITNPDEQQAKEKYTYKSSPKVTSISPPSGKLASGTKITITGTGFIDQISGAEEKLTVTIGEVDVTEDVQFISETQLIVTTPEHESGEVDVIITNPDEQYAEAIFTYNPFPKIIGISPPSGNPNVITPITITGENFIERIPGMTDWIQVQVGNIQVIDKDIQFLSSNELRIFAPKGPPGNERIVVTNPDGQSSQEDLEYIYNFPPKVTEISPESGTIGTTISITGENFIPEILEESLRVTIGGTPVVDIKSMTSNEIQFVVPDIELFGLVPVIVINPDGQQSETIVSFTYIPGPTVRKITPSSGRLDGGTKITIEGTGFTEKIGERRIQVEFEGILVVPDTDVEFVSLEKLIVSTPKSESPEMVYVIVTNPDGQLSKKSPDATFMYNPRPKIESILPKSGKLAGGTTLIITGEYFIQAIPGVEKGLTVTIGGLEATSVFFVSVRELHVTTPARPESGEVEIIIINPDGQQAEGNFTYNPPPTVTNISPPSGKLAGGTQITIIGTGFISQIPGGEANLRVTIGGVTTGEVQFISGNQLTTITPERYQSGEVDIIVTNPDRQQAKGIFTYNTIPTITSILPPSGKLDGGTAINVIGTGFIKEIPGVEAKLTVTIGGVAVEEVRFNSSTQLSVITLKRNQSGEVDVIITNPDEQEAKGTYIYNPIPTVTSISPTSGKLASGTEITITGTGFIEQILDKRLSIQIGNIDATANIEFILPTQIVLTTPASLEPKTVDVIITNPDGQKTPSTQFTYNPFPAVDSITPDRGTAGTLVTIRGSNFIGKISDKDISLKIGYISIDEINDVSSKEITFTAPAHVFGSFRVIVINPDGQESQQLINFTYNPVPTITDILPPRGRVDGGTEIILKGSGFICEPITTPKQETPKQIQVKIGNQSVEIDGCSPTELRFTTPANSEPGDVDITVTNPDGQEVKGTYTYNELPTVTDISPPSGKLAGGTKITITGTGFIEQILDKHLSIFFEDIDATPNIEFILPTQIALTTPASLEPKTVDVIITNPDEQKALIKFTYNPFPTIENITPDRGTGGAEVTISGNNFIERISDQDIRLKVGSTFVGNVNFVSSSEITFTAPVHEIGSFPIVVINPDGQESQQIINFTYNPAITITEISPLCGSVNGGTKVTLKGSGFICDEIPTLENIQIKIGNESVELDGCSPTELTFTTPPGSKSGEVDVIVTNPDGQQAKGKFIYISEPIVLSVVPKVGNPVGDTPITIKGENFIECTKQSIKVEIGGREAQFFTKLSDTEIIARTPPAETPGKPVPVVVINPDGQQSSGDKEFTYNDYLKISDISPKMGSHAGGTEVTISGTGFTIKEDIPVKVLFGDVEAEVLEVVSPAQLIILTPSGEPEAVVDVTIENDDRQEFTMPKGFRYTDRLVASKISPTIGPVIGGTEVVINGSGFIKGIGAQEIEVTFGGKPVNKIVSVEPTKLKVLTPPGERDKSSVEVIVMGADGQSITLPDQFHYIDFPKDVLVYNYPNPTPVGRGTTFRFSDSSGNVEIKIFNMAGVLVWKHRANGGNTIAWDGKDRFDNVARFGLYPYVYLVDGDVKQRQLLHIKP